MVVKGNLKLDIDEQGLEARVTILPDETGADLSVEGVLAALEKKRVRAGIDTEAIEKAFRTLTRKKAEPVVFVAAAGVLPRPPEPEGVEFEPHAIPKRLENVAGIVLAKAPPPVGFRVREERVKKERKVLKKPALPFLQAQEEVEVVFEKKLVREVVSVDPAVTETGFVGKGALVAKIRPARPGKEGKSVFGRFVPPPRAELQGYLFCEGLERTGNEVRAATAGFLRRGANWSDVVAFRDHVIETTASADGTTCLLSFEPGDPAAPAPDPVDIIASAEKLGFSAAGLLGPGEIGALLRTAVETKTPFATKPLTPSADGMVSVIVSADKLSAILTLRKGRGGGRPLTPGAVSDAIRASKVRRYSTETVRQDIQAFFKGPEMELAGYQLAVGQPPQAGKDGTVEWLAKFLTPEECKRVRAVSAARASALAGIASLVEFPLESVDTVGRVTVEMPVLRIVPGFVGPSGVDVFGAVVPGLHGATPEVRLFEGLQQRRELVVAIEEGLLEKGSGGMTILLRVRPFRDAELNVTISEDRMKGFLSYLPPRGTGSTMDAQKVRALIEEAGIVRGLDEGRLVKVLEVISRGKAFSNILIAEGRRPPPGTEDLVTFHVHLATGKAVTLRADGTADFRTQDRITHVGKGVHLATLKPPPLEGRDSWDVTGKPVPPPPGSLDSLKGGRGVSTVVQPDGSLRYYAQVEGELVRDASLIEVHEIHTVDGDVDMGVGNVSFPGIVRIRGSVRAGFRVMATGDIEVEETTEGATLSSEGSILIGQGIKGDGKAILRAKKSISAPFAEQAALHAAENIHLKGACLRCQVTCNGKLLLDSEKGSLVGGEVKARQGIAVQNLGSPGGIRTVVQFGQDFLLKDQIDREEIEVASFSKRVLELDAEIKNMQKEAQAGHAADPATLSHKRDERAQLLKAIEQRKLSLIAQHDTFDLHTPSEILVRGTLFPGVVIESHGRHWETRTEKNMITLYFNETQGKIAERL
jgi:uncharacterized protein